MQEPRTHLLTLTEPSGVGKTRLALAAGECLASQFADGVFFVDLAPVHDPALVLSALATTLGVREAPGRPLREVVQTYVRDRALLLIIDNFEQVLEAAAVIAELLVAGPQLTALVTSRAALRVRGEREYPVPTLRLPTHDAMQDLSVLASNEAVAFFVDRAQAVRPDLTLTPENAAVITEICTRLDGLPLALELAAARIKMLSPQTLLSRLEARLPLLTGGARDAPARHRTLRDTIAWSHDLLTDEERALFRRLGVFVGGWTLEAASAVAGDGGDLAVLDGLASLGDKSLIHLTATATPRYGMLETIREFAREQLLRHDELPTAAAAHAAYMVALARACERAMLTPEQTVSHQQMGADLGNLRAALTWLEQVGDAESMQTVAACCWWVLADRASASEAREWLERALAIPHPASAQTRAVALSMAGIIAVQQGDLPAAAAFADAALAVSRAHGLIFGTGLARFSQAMVASEHADYPRATALGEEAIGLLRQGDDHRWLAVALNDIGFFTTLNGDLARRDAWRSARRARPLPREPDPGPRHWSHVVRRPAPGGHRGAGQSSRDDRRRRALAGNRLRVTPDPGDERLSS